MLARATEWIRVRKDHMLMKYTTVLGDIGMAFVNRGILSASISGAFLVCGCKQPPAKIEIGETRRVDVPIAISAGGGLRWEGEDIYYFTSHAPGPGFQSNPYSFYLILNSIPGGLEVKADGETWTHLGFETAPPPNRPRISYQFGPVPGADPNDGTMVRNQLWLAPAAGPMVIDQGRQWTLQVSDLGGSQSTGTPVPRAIKVAYVAPGRCLMQGIELPQTASAGSTVTLTLNAGPSCKFASIDEEVGTGRTRIYEAVSPTIGGTFTASMPRTVPAQGVRFTFRAVDAAGTTAMESFIVQAEPEGGPTGSFTRSVPSGGSGGNQQTPAQPCPGTANGQRSLMTYCISCPAGASRTDEIPTRRPTLTQSEGAYCTAEEAEAHLRSSYGGCAITRGACN